MGLGVGARVGRLVRSDDWGRLTLAGVSTEVVDGVVTASSLFVVTITTIGDVVGGEGTVSGMMAVRQDLVHVDCELQYVGPMPHTPSEERQNSNCSGILSGTGHGRSVHNNDS